MQHNTAVFGYFHCTCLKYDDTVKAGVFWHSFIYTQPSRHTTLNIHSAHM